MSEASRCAKCGGALLAGRCPRCLLELGFETASGDTPTVTTSAARREPDRAKHQANAGGSGAAAQNAAGSASPSTIARYRIIRLIGEGGMGAVYEAEQEQPRRTVALKVIKPGLATPELLRRFEQEAEALGRLQHPGIAQIYEAGTADMGSGPQPYFAMEFIRGSSLRDYAEGHHLNTRQRLEILAKVAEAVHHAHQRGLIHRDLKPGNILVDQTGQPKILDFGVARVTDSEAQATMQTDVGQLVGTLAYMSPEQVLADPLELDIRSDVYALGVILYELLAGRLPYTISKRLHEAIQAIREEDPARLSSVNRTYRGDIETIVAKALEKDKARRYASAAEFGADIRRSLMDEPIVARPPSTAYQLGKFARRHKALVAGVAAVFVVLAIGVVVSRQQAMRARRAERVAVDEKVRAEQSAQSEKAARAAETQQRQLAEAARVQSEEQKVAAQHALSAAEQNLYFNNIDLADRESMAANIGHVDQLLAEAPAALRNWEWNYLTGIGHMEEAVIAGHRDEILDLRFDADGRLHTVSKDNTARVWDVAAHKEVSSKSFPRAANSEIGEMTLGADGRMVYMQVTSIAPMSFTQRFWNLSADKEGFVLSAFTTTQNRGSAAVLAPYGSVIMSPDGNRVVAVSFQLETAPPRPIYLLRSWDLATGRELGSLGRYEDMIQQLAFSGDGTRLAIVQAGSTRIVNATSGQELVTLNNSRDAYALAFSRDGATIAAGITNEGLRSWNTATGSERWSVRADGRISRIVFSVDGRLLAIALEDRTIRILDAETGRELARLMGHTGVVRALGFSPDGTRLVSGGADKLLRVWQVPLRRPAEVFDTGTASLGSVRVSPDAKTLMVLTGNQLKSWDLNTGKPGIARSGYSTTFYPSIIGEFTGFDKEGAWMVLLLTNPVRTGPSSTTEVRVVDTRSGRELVLLRPSQKEGRFQIPQDVRLSPGADRAALVLSSVTVSQRAASPASGGAYVGGVDVHLWDTATGKLITSLTLGLSAVGASLQFSPGRTLFALASVSPTNDGRLTGEIGLYDLKGRRLHALDIGRQETRPIFVFSPDGNRLAAVANSRNVGIWDVRSGTRLVSFPELTSTVASMAFNPDGTRLVSVSADGNVQLWDASSGKALIPLRESNALVQTHIVTGRPPTPTARTFSISFSPDGGKILLSTVSPDPKGMNVRIATWDGTPRPAGR